MPRLGVPLGVPIVPPPRVLRTSVARNLILREPSLRKNLYDEPIPLPRSTRSRQKTIDLTVLSRVSINSSLTPKKGRKEGVSMATELAEGAKAPAFELPRDGGCNVSLEDFKGKKLVIYFYPKADTPGCTRESIDFSKLRAEFQKAQNKDESQNSPARARQNQRQPSFRVSVRRD